LSSHNGRGTFTAARVTLHPSHTRKLSARWLLISLVHRCFKKSAQSRKSKKKTKRRGKRRKEEGKEKRERKKKEKKKIQKKKGEGERTKGKEKAK